MILKAIPHKSKFFIIFLFFFSIIINQYYASMGVFPQDTFLHFDSGYRILKGEAPFKDYWTVSGPLVDYMQAFFFYLFGATWTSYILHASLFNALLTLLSSKITRIRQRQPVYQNYCFKSQSANCTTTSLEVYRRQRI